MLFWPEYQETSSIVGCAVWNEAQHLIQVSALWSVALANASSRVVRENADSTTRLPSL